MTAPGCVTVQLRDVPVPDHRQIKAAAVLAGESLQAFVLRAALERAQRLSNDTTAPSAQDR